MGRYAGVVAFYQGQIALVRERFHTWDRDYWNLPSGAIEEGESPEEGAIRELREETGLLAGDLELVWTTSTVVNGEVTGRSWNYATTVEDPAFAIDDPDGLVQEVAWFPLDQALRLLAEVPVPPMSVPARAYLEGGPGRLLGWEFWHVDPSDLVSGWRWRSSVDEGAGRRGRLVQGSPPIHPQNGNTNQ